MSTMAMALIGACVAVLVLFGLLVRARAQRLGVQLSDLQLLEHARVDREKELLSSIAELRTVHTRLEAQVKDEKRKSSEYFAMIDGAVNETKKWRQMYYDEASGHGQAQSMLMRERATLVAQLHKAGVRPRTNPKIEQVVADFGQNHPQAGMRLDEESRNGEGTGAT